MRYLLLMLLLANTVVGWGQRLQTQPLADDIATIQTYVQGNPNSLPIINLNGQSQIYIGFDRLGDDAYNMLQYRIIHCDRNWVPSTGISEIDYLDGFNDSYINDYALSINTTVEYTHFQMTVPNNDIRLKLSGNYAVQVYDENDRDRILLTACFTVVDSQVKIGMSVSSDTDIDTNKKHQQVSLVLNPSGVSIRDPFKDLSIQVRQNNRIDNERIITKPSLISGSKLTYDHIRDLIFEAGNEYRRFETSTYRSNGYRVAHIEYRRPYYYADIATDYIRANRTYSYDQDQNGKFFIRSIDADGDSNIYGDYIQTKFTLSAPSPVSGDVYINGGFTDDLFNSKYLMKYDLMTEEYTQTLLLKQGLYNYQYLTQLADGAYSASVIEGDYYETEDEYTAYVYYRPQGQRYDSLIGTATIQSRSK